MTETALDLFVARTRDCWRAPNSDLVANCAAHLADLLRARPSEAWLAKLLDERPESRELYRDPVHGFVLLGHTEAEGRYRVPHDHGASWVIYGVLRGEMEMGSYARCGDSAPLIKRGSTRVRHGEVQVYLPGDIHDTRCIAGPAIQFRFTARNLRLETTMRRYVEGAGGWVAEA